MANLLLLLCPLFPVTCPLSFAQNESATLSGRVSDPSGAAIVGAEVVLTNVDTNIEQRTKTNNAGLYVFAGVRPGKYRVAAGSTGFKTLIKENLVLHVQDELAENFSLSLGSLAETVTVEADALGINTQDAAVSTVVDRNFVESLPLNGRSFNTLLQLTPGVVIAPTNGFDSSLGQFSIAGQRTDANNFTVDGVSANFGVGSSAAIQGSGTGTALAFSALGGTSSLISVEALQEFRIETSSVAPEFGRSPGGQVILTTRSGTNDFHGGLYEYFRNTVLDANDWFANKAGNPRAPEHHNDFGGYLGGRVFKDKSFFFVSYEGARLGQPQTFPFPVPSTFARTQAPTTLAPFLNAYPLPNGQPISPTAYVAPYTQSVSNRATLDAGSVRIDHTFDSRFSIFGRYNNAPSKVMVAGFNPTTTETNTQILTIGVNMQFSNRTLNTLRGNYSTQNSGLATALSAFGGAVPLSPTLLLGTLPSASTFVEFGTFDTTSFGLGPNANNRTRQLNFVDDLSWSLGKHQVKFGGDYRAIYLDKRPFQNELLFSAPTVQGFVSTPTAGQVSLLAGTANRAQFLSQALSLYGEDTWKITPRLALTYGLRWELSPAPSARGKTTLAAWTNVNNPAALALAPAGTPVWRTTYGNFAPRAGIAYSLTDKGDFVVRAGGGVFYDLGVGQAVQLGNSFPNFAFANSVVTVTVPLTDAKPFLPSLSLLPPFAGAQAYSPDLKLPRSYQWNVALEKSFGGQQVISGTYVGQAGRDLLRQEALFQPNPNFTGDFLLWREDAFSNYNALQLQYRRPLSSRVQALLNYTWSHSLDNASNDVLVGLSNTVISAARDYASSDFDVRQSFSGAITYAIPGVSRYKALSLVTKDWSVDTVIVARSGFPFNAFLLLQSADPGGRAATRPDLVLGQPLWIKQVSAPGGKMLNANAFVVPVPLAQGTEGRNDIPGFGLTEVDFSIVRKFSITESVNLRFRADAFNLFNHPSFINPNGLIEFGAFGLQSQHMLNQGLGGLNPLFQEGGPRSLQLSLTLNF